MLVNWSLEPRFDGFVSATVRGDAARMHSIGAHVHREPVVRLSAADHVTRAPAKQLPESVFELLLQITAQSK